MNLRYDALPGEWQDEEPIIAEPWPWGDTADFREGEPMKACNICGATTDLEPAGDQHDGWPIYGCRNVYACMARFDALLKATETPRTAELAGVTVQGV